MIDYLTIDKFAADSGHTRAAVYKKISRGEWLEGHVYIKRGGRIYISVQGYNRWVEQGPASVPPQKARSKSTSATGAFGAASAST